MEKTVYKNFLFRFLIIYSFQLMIKGFDQTFGSFFDITARGQLFSLMFVIIWLFAWYISERINQKFHSIFYIKIVLNLLFGFSVSLLTNVLYRLGDSILFDKSYLWEDISFVNPELTISLLLFYVLFYSINEFIKSNLKVKEEQIRSEQLGKEKALAQYKSLKSQIEPHFLFNSLSILSSIIHTDKDLASEFLEKLSKTLRYIIERSNQVLVPLRKEMEIVKDYYFLLETRFGKSIQLKIRINEESLDTLFVPPTSVQALLENAVKHNKQSNTNPLIIDITEDSQVLCVTNNLNKRKSSETSTGTGLKNINSRYELLSRHTISIEESDNQFIVKLPLLNKDFYESINY